MVNSQPAHKVTKDQFAKPWPARHIKGGELRSAADVKSTRDFLMRDATPVDETIRQKLEAVFKPAQLEVVNESHLHGGHAGSPGTGHSHFRVRIVAEAFRGQSRLACHRRVNDVLADELKGTVHALAISTSAPV